MKKWTYLVAACMLAGATPVITGCVDTDEPAGIEQLRGAKAELLRAKVKIVEAQAKNVEAQNALLEVDKRIKEAQARIQEALAEREEAYATLAKDSADYLASILDMKIELHQAEIDAAIAKQKEAQAAAQAAYMEAIKELILAQSSLTEDEMACLYPYTQDVNIAQWKVGYWQYELDQATKNLKEVNRTLLLDSLNTTYHIKLQRKVQKSEAKWNTKKEALAEIQEIRALAETNPDVTRWEKELQELENDMDSLEVLNADLQILEAKYKSEHKAERTQMVDSLAKAYAYGADGKYVDVDGEEQDYSTLLNEFGINVGSGSEPFEVKGEEYSREWETSTFGLRGLKLDLGNFSYTYDDYVEGQEDLAEGTTETELAHRGIEPYWTLDQIAFFRRGVELYTLNENGEAWKENDRAYAVKDTVARKDAYQEALAAWQEAVDAYQYAGTVTDPLKLEVGKALNDSIDKYNTAAAAHKVAKDALYAARTKLTNTILGISIKRYSTAADAPADYAPAATSTYADYETVRGEVEDMITTLTQDVADTGAEVERLKAEHPDPTASESALIAAAEANFTNATNILTAANSIVTSLDTDKEALAGEYSFESWTDGAEKTWRDAYDAAELAYKHVLDAYTIYTQYFVSTYTDTDDPLGNKSDITKVVPDEGFLSDDNYITAIVNADVLEVSQATLKEALETMSKNVWGNGWLNKEDNCRLVAPTEADVIANIKADYAAHNAGRELPDYLVQFYYADGYTTETTDSKYGAYGLYLASKAAYNRMDDFLKNGGEEIKSILADIDEVDAALRATLAANAKTVEALIAYFEEKNEAYNEGFATEVGGKVDEAEFAREIIKPVKEALEGAIQGYINAVKKDNSITDNISTLEALLEALDGMVAEADEAVAKAYEDYVANQEQLTRYEQLGERGTNEDGEKQYLTWILEDAKDRLQTAQDELKAAQDELKTATDALTAVVEDVLNQANAIYNGTFGE